MSASAKKVEIALPALLTADDEWNLQLSKSGLKGTV
jgi:hypothetical protein